MEFMNKIELRGVVGRADVNNVGGRNVCNFSVVTEYSQRDRDGVPSTDVMWFNVSLWEREGQPLDLYPIEKGAWIEVSGRLRQRKYISSIDGLERLSLDVIAQSATVLAKDGSMQPQH